MARSNGVPAGVKMAVRPAVISGPSGSGKSTLVKRLMKEYTGCFALSVSRKFKLQL